MNRAIEKNEIVTVVRNAQPGEGPFIRRALILHVASATGELWGFKDLDTAREVWTNEPFTIERTDPGPAYWSALWPAGLWPRNRALVPTRKDFGL